MNPKISLAYGLNSNDFSSLRCAIKENTGLEYGYIAHDMVDTQILSATLTLCGYGKRKVSTMNRLILKATIKAWGIGRGYGCPKIVFPDETQYG